MSLRRRHICYGGKPKFKFKTSATFSNISGGGASVTFPSTISPGDLIVLLDVCIGGTSAPTLKKPPGFSTAISDTFSAATPFASIMFAYKLADASDAGRTYTAMSPSTGEDVVIVAVFEVLGGSFNSYASGDPYVDLGKGGTPPAQTITGATAPAITFGLWAQLTTPSTTFSPSADGTVSKTGFSLHSKLSYKIFQTSSADVTITLGSDPSTNCMAGCFINGVL